MIMREELVSIVTVRIGTANVAELRSITTDEVAAGTVSQCIISVVIVACNVSAG